LDSFRTLRQRSTAYINEKNSKFYAYAFPAENIEDWQNALKTIEEEHAKARHICYAYRLDTEGNNYRVNDAGEPSGSAGKPLLNVIDSNNLHCCAIVVVRYFGGTKLGIPGLIKAYKMAGSAVIKDSEIVIKEILINREVELPFHKYARFMDDIKKTNISIISSETLDNGMKFSLSIPKSQESSLSTLINSLES